jgi:hypothetical protein
MPTDPTGTRFTGSRVVRLRRGARPLPIVAAGSVTRAALKARRKARRVKVAPGSPAEAKLIEERASSTAPAVPMPDAGEWGPALPDINPAPEIIDDGGAEVFPFPGVEDAPPVELPENVADALEDPNAPTVGVAVDGELVDVPTAAADFAAELESRGLEGLGFLKWIKRTINRNKNTIKAVAGGAAGPASGLISAAVDMAAGGTKNKGKKKAPTRPPVQPITPQNPAPINARQTPARPAPRSALASVPTWAWFVGGLAALGLVVGLVRK